MHSAFFLLVLATASGLVKALPAPDASLLTEYDLSTEPLNLTRTEKRYSIFSRSSYDGIVNNSCILAPESPKDNYVSGSPMKTDITSGQSGLPFTLDVAVMDVNSCEPVATMVEVWSSNARGDHGNFLRGATSSSQNGIAEFQTIFPGWSDGDGANHVNIAVHSTSDISSPTIHVGKLYFTDRWTDLIGKTSPYNENSNSRILNEDDPDFKDALAEGYSPVISIAPIEDDWVEGIVGIITVGVRL
ncbi:hypothetical protein Agabi119p4_11292 [Agaricus bisporus var. burnettii]|uniref:Intradiol ring-cleavage dioxygenases domain-containing protein n=1 Tax=Agaricus bisporus var. burnettii TaxID=192524 RepID=A0A8H7EW20_AGABI|nr:hypothetical protein Agabi119p4_11292 [Agaricus bisporus var. burnettii]